MSTGWRIWKAVVESCLSKTRGTRMIADANYYVDVVHRQSGAWPTCRSLAQDRHCVEPIFQSSCNLPTFPSTSHSHSSRHWPRFWLLGTPRTSFARLDKSDHSLLRNIASTNASPTSTRTSRRERLRWDVERHPPYEAQTIDSENIDASPVACVSKLAPFVWNLGFTHRAPFFRDFSRNLANATCRTTCDTRHATCDMRRANTCWTTCDTRHATDIKCGCTGAVVYTWATSTLIEARGAEHISIS